MNLKVAYCPFPNDNSMIGNTQAVVDSHNSKHKFDRFDGKVVVSGAKALQHVSWFQQLYIVAHGDSGSDSITGDDGSSITMDALAKQLRDEKLTVAIRKVKLFVCEGGKGDGSTASKLKIAMRREGFTRVSVYGYTLCLAIGALTDDGRHKLAADLEEDDEGDLVPIAGTVTGAKSSRRKF